MKQVLILHAWFATPKDHWYPWLKTELEKKDYQVFIPELKDKDKPTLKRWTSCALKGIKLDENTAVIGHSLGAVLALRLAESYKIGKLVLVAGWDFWDLTPEHETFFKKPIDHKKIKQNVKKIVVIYSDNDPYSTLWQGEQFAKRLGARFLLKKGKGHFTKEDGVEKIPIVLKMMR